MFIERPFWHKLITDAWRERSVIWLMGARRAGKTSLCKSLNGVHYFDCESPRVRQLFVDPEGFLESLKGKKVVFDEIHRLDNPSEFLKLAADHYPSVKIIATGSSTLGASAKFRDTLTGRKEEIWLTPLLLEELSLFGNADLRHRFLFGGFPPFFLAKNLPERHFQEWIDSYWAKDIQDIFSVGKRASFEKFAELLMVNSSGLFEATRYTASCEASRITITNYLSVLEQTFVVHVIRPFSTHKTTEIISAPKVYGMDTGFVNYCKGRTELRDEDCGFMWEHVVLNELQGRLQTRSINYWRNKSGHEIDFILPKRGGTNITAIECKFLFSGNDDSIRKNFGAFRKNYPNGLNLVVASNIDTPFDRRFDDLVVSFISPKNLIDVLSQ